MTGRATGRVRGRSSISPGPLAALAGVVLAAALASSPVAAQSAATVTGDEPIVGLPCEGCELVFEGIPTELEAEARIAPTEEPGEPMRIIGTVRRADGTPAPGTVIYAYHTDSRGLYPRAATRHGRLRGWAQADEAGRYRFDTIRPAGYPSSTATQHVHMHVIEPGRCTYYIDSIEFTDDPRFMAGGGPDENDGRGGSGVVTPRREAGVWVAERDIVLGDNVPGYEACARQGGGSMYGLIGKMTAVPGQRDALIAILLEGVSGMPGCLSYVVARDPTDPDAIWITEVWDSKDSHEASLSLPAVREAISRGRPLIAGFSDNVETEPVGGHGLTEAKKR